MSDSDSREHPEKEQVHEADPLDPVPASKAPLPKNRRKWLIGACAGFLLIGGILWWGATQGWFGIPPGKAVQIGNQTISKDELEHWTDVLAAQRGPEAAPLDSPEFTQCTRQTSQMQEVSQEKALGQCKLEFEQAKRSAAEILIGYVWLEKEAESRNIEISDKKVEEAYQKQKKEFYPSEQEFQELLKSTNQTVDDLRKRTRLELLSTELQKQLQEQALRGYRPDEKRSRAYFKENRAQFTTPASFQIQILVTKSRSDAEAAIKAIEDDRSLQTIFEKYALDSEAAQAAQKVEDIPADDSFPLLEQAEDASKGDTLGPEKIDENTWYIGLYQGFTREKKPTFEEAQSQVQDQLSAQAQSQLSEKFIAEFNKKYTDQTTCSEEYRNSLCKNAPSEPASPQNGQNPQVPQQPELGPEGAAPPPEPQG